MRKLPIYILIDTSGSMRGEPIEAVKVGLRALIASLNRDPHALESVHISIITFDREAKVLLPMTELQGLKLPEIEAPQSSPTNLGEALELMCELYDKQVVKSSANQKGDWMPLGIVMTDGSPSDTMLFEQMCQKLKSYRFARIIACAAGHKAKKEPLQKFATDTVSIETMDSNSFVQFFQWVSQSVAKHSKSSVITGNELPTPPSEIVINV
ncbi:MAG: VWA domain-containing protein [Deltaproteobacteria bacterium]|jgi:uncharacterized protein YegL|nr:VWA domain-containing protein [Deltaproteobacteria bacterium]